MCHRQPNHVHVAQGVHFLASLPMARLVSLRDCLAAVSSHEGLAEHGHSKALQDSIIRQIFEHLATMGLEQYCPPPLMGHAELDTMAALIAVKYFDHVAADSKPLTKVCLLIIQCSVLACSVCKCDASSSSSLSVTCNCSLQ